MPARYDKRFPCPQCGEEVKWFHDDRGKDPPSYIAATYWIFEPCGHRFKEFTMDVSTGIITRFTPLLPDGKWPTGTP